MDGYDGAVVSPRGRQSTSASLEPSERQMQDSMERSCISRISSSYFKLDWNTTLGEMVMSQTTAMLAYY